MKELASSGFSKSKSVVNALLSPFGIYVARRKVQPLRRMTSDLAIGVLSSKKRASIVDVGAGHGDFSAEILKSFPNSNIICIEPIKENAQTIIERFKNQDVKVECVAAGDYNGKAIFYETVASYSSSTLPMGRHQIEFPAESQLAATYSVPMLRMDTILSRNNFDTQLIDLLKIDTQGSELQVLRGSEYTQSKCRHVILELSLLPLYDGQSSFQELVCFMFQKGYQIIDHCEGARSRTTSELLQMDFLFRSTSKEP